MKVLFIHRYCGMGGVTAGIRKKYLGLKRFGIDVEFLFLHDKGGRCMFRDIDIRLYQSNDASETLKIILGNGYDFISSIDCPEVHGLLSTLPGDIKIFCEVRTAYPEDSAYISQGQFPSRLKCIVTPSEAFRKFLESGIGKFRAIPVRVIPNSVDQRFFDRGGNDTGRIPRKYIGWIGRADETKGYKEALRIAESFSPTRHDVEFLFVGRFPLGYDSKISRSFASFGERINFKWLPHLEYQGIHNFYRLLRDSGGCFLTTSRGESQSNTVLESMASGCPVVATDIDVFKEVLEGGRCGAMYASGNVESAAGLINRTLDDRQFRDGIIDNAYSKVRNGFTAEKVYEQWKMLFEDLCSS